MEYTNFKHINTTCPECKHTEILEDNIHQEIFCTRCGLILSDTRIFKITHILNEEQRKNERLNEFWRMTNKKKRESNSHGGLDG